jgi:A/G-specific adenine glycosylase
VEVREFKETYLIKSISNKTENVEKFQSLILDFFQEHGRSLPWRENKTPYNVFISEFMLQQTQAERVIPKFIEFTSEFPDFSAIAKASFADVLQQWQGLGYNRRARYLHDSAKKITFEYKQILPDDTQLLQKLPGIGYATASAIRAYAFNAPVIYIETNIRSVFIHHFFADKENVNDKEILPLVEKYLYREKPAMWYSALMDYGVMLKKAVNNPGRKSRHHIKQSTFTGSRRQLRGMIIRILLNSEKATLNELIRECGRGKEEVHSVLTDLEKEHFIKLYNGYYSIKK